MRNAMSSVKTHSDVTRTVLCRVRSLEQSAKTKLLDWDPDLKSDAIDEVLLNQFGDTFAPADGHLTCLGVAHVTILTLYAVQFSDHIRQKTAEGELSQL